MKVLVTGAGGFVGGQIVKGWDVDFVPYGITATGDDIFDTEKLAAAMTGCDVVLHLAAYPHRESAPDWGAFKHLNVDGVKAVAETALKCGVKRFVYMSSGNVYCFGDGIDDQDDRQPPIGVDDYPDPEKMHAYPRSKIYAERYLKKVQARKQKKFDTVIVLRPNHFAPTPKEVMQLWRGTTITMDRLVRYTRNACGRDIKQRFVIYDVIEPTPNYPSSIAAQQALD